MSALPKTEDAIGGAQSLCLRVLHSSRHRKQILEEP